MDDILLAYDIPTGIAYFYDKDFKVSFMWPWRGYNRFYAGITDAGRSALDLDRARFDILHMETDEEKGHLSPLQH